MVCDEYSDCLNTWAVLIVESDLTPLAFYDCIINKFASEFRESQAQ